MDKWTSRFPKFRKFQYTLSSSEVGQRVERSLTGSNPSGSHGIAWILFGSKHEPEGGIRFEASYRGRPVSRRRGFEESPIEPGNFGHAECFIWRIDSHMVSFRALFGQSSMVFSSLCLGRVVARYSPPRARLPMGTSQGDGPGLGAGATCAAFRLLQRYRLHVLAAEVAGINNRGEQEMEARSSDIFMRRFVWRIAFLPGS